MILQIKKYFFWLFVDQREKEWYDFWINIDLDSYMRFRKFARDHEFYDDNSPITDQDTTSMLSILSDYFNVEINSTFDAKFYAWLTSLK